jgi:hypothetical protein
MQEVFNGLVGSANEAMLAKENEIARILLPDADVTLGQLRGSLDGAHEELDQLSLQVNDLSVDSESEHVQDLAARLAERSLKTLSTLTTFDAKKETLKDSMREVVESRAGSIGAFLHEARLMVEGDPTSDFQTTELNLAETRLEALKDFPKTSIDEVDNKLKTLTHTLSGINGVMGEKQGDIAAAAAEAAAAAATAAATAAASAAEAAAASAAEAAAVAVDRVGADKVVGAVDALMAERSKGIFRGAPPSQKTGAEWTALTAAVESYKEEGGKTPKNIGTMVGKLKNFLDPVIVKEGKAGKASTYKHGKHTGHRRDALRKTLFEPESEAAKTSASQAEDNAAEREKYLKEITSKAEAGGGAARARTLSGSDVEPPPGGAKAVSGKENEGSGRSNRR